MDEIALSELIEQMKDSIRSFEHSRTTVDNYQFAWRALANYFIEHNQVMFSKQLAEQYILESKAPRLSHSSQIHRHQQNGFF